MLSSVTDLLRYIDENQLTSEFGGTLDYCHSDWIVLRTVSGEQLCNSSGVHSDLMLHFPEILLLLPLQAIESFAVMVKDIAQMLQSFGTELAETELPDDRKDTERLLETHAAKYRKLKVSKGSCVISAIAGVHITLTLVLYIPKRSMWQLTYAFLLNLLKRMLSSRCQRRVIIFS